MRPQIIRTTSYDQGEILRSISKLHLDGEGFECDVTYGKGLFWKNAALKPKFRFDVNPNLNHVTCVADASKLPLKDGVLKNIVFDPPFLIRTGKGSVIKDRFGDFVSVAELWLFYGSVLKEFYRVLKPNGICVFKCQDTILGGKQIWSHIRVFRDAEKVGFYPLDLFVLIAKNRIIGKHKTQQHARKFHSFFWVFRK